MELSNRKEKLGFPKSYAFIIGINEYPLINGNLATAVTDAKRLAEILEQQQGFDHVEFFKNIKGDEFRALLQRIKDPTQYPKIKPSDSILFYYAGHGKAGEFEDGPAGFLLPSDTKPNSGRLENETLIPMGDVFETLKDIDCHHTFLILDCCFAGKFRHVKSTSRDTELRAFLPLYEERFEKYKRQKAWQVLVSSGPDQTAADWLGNRFENSRTKHSPFAEALFKALEGEAELKPKNRNLGDGVITAHELFLYVWHEVEQRTNEDVNFKTQYPDLFPMGAHEGGEFIFFHPKHALNFAERKDRNPYPGLHAYTEKSSDLYFGRRERVKEALNKLEHTNILVISAPSGFGKTSFVKAGIYPQLKKLFNAELTTFRPGANPTKEWETLNFKINPEQYQVLLLDQFEELYTECENKQEARYFDQKLHDLFSTIARGNFQDNVKVIITIRSDFEWQFEASEAAKAFWEKRELQKFFYRLPPMVLDELREALIQPALVETYDFESEKLINHILEEASYAPGALPMLSFGMHELVNITDKRTRLFTAKNYHKVLGGISGALSKKADELYDSLPDNAHKKTMQRLFLRMVSLKDGTYVRRKVPVSNNEQTTTGLKFHELDYPNDAEDKMVITVLDKLVAAGLIIQGSDQFQQPYVEPVHDAIINFWPKCLHWIKEFGDETIVLQRQLWSAAKAYIESEKATYALWEKDPRLENVYNLFRNPLINHWFNELEIEFIQASRARYVSELDRIKRERDEAQSSAMAAKALLAFPRNNTQALQLAFKAYQTYPTEEAARTIHDILGNPDKRISKRLGPSDFSFGEEPSTNGLFSLGSTGLPISITAIGLSIDGFSIFTAHGDSQIRRWKYPFKQSFTQFEVPEAVHSLTCSTNGALLYVGCASAAYVYDLKTAKVLAKLKLGSEEDLSEGFYDGKFVQGDDVLMIQKGTKETAKSVIVWEFAKSSSEYQGILSTEDSIIHAFGCTSGNNPSYLVYDADWGCRIWDKNYAQLSAKKIEGPQMGIYGFSEPAMPKGMALSPDCKKLVTYDESGKFSVRSTEAEGAGSVGHDQGLLELKGLDHPVGFQFSNDGSLLIAFSESGTAVVWDVTTGENLFWIHLPGVDAALCNLHSAGGLIVLSALDTVHVWNMNPDALLQEEEIKQVIRERENKFLESSVSELEKAFREQARSMEIPKYSIAKCYLSSGQDYLLAIHAEEGAEAVSVQSKHYKITSWFIQFSDGVYTFSQKQELKRDFIEVTDVLFDSNDFALIASPELYVVYVWDYKNGQLVWTMEDTCWKKMGWNSDGSKLLLEDLENRFEAIDYFISDW